MAHIAGCGPCVLSMWSAPVTVSAERVWGARSPTRCCAVGYPRRGSTWGPGHDPRAQSDRAVVSAGPGFEKEGYQVNRWLCMCCGISLRRVSPGVRHYMCRRCASEGHGTPCRLFSGAMRPRPVAEAPAPRPPQGLDSPVTTEARSGSTETATAGQPCSPVKDLGCLLVDGWWCLALVSCRPALAQGLYPLTASCSARTRA